MDLGFFYGCLVTLCLLSAAQCSLTERCPCNGIPEFKGDGIGHLMGHCHQEPKMELRYACKDGYRRKAGTSNLLKCQLYGWKTPNLICIPDPKRNPAKTTSDPSTTTLKPSVAMTTSSCRNRTTSPAIGPSANDPSTTTVKPPIAMTTSSGPKRITRPPIVPTASKSSGKTTTVISCSTIVILIFGGGICFVCYRRRRRWIHSNIPRGREEVIPMNPTS
ncbi:interleukin-15 receptor subunit alpha-like isoform X3 [Synchiropus splendidus]|uniref:interleukin-15 receptor subunit alpha-like isoform X3 n=1 Tax=Synchiropus splendidus TaxID=270530 RepID=UPI00237DED60|nr:interleukin-15 receptor subunit alpha-like isoform X3 [Synchiropus splendidus]